MTAHFKASEIEAIAEHVLELYRNKSNRRLIVAIAGAPGSGKTTLAGKLVAELNKHLKAALLSQDGFHFSRAQLGEFADPEEAIRTRGAPSTFDAAGFVRTVSQLNSPEYEGKAIVAPSFDHKLKDPVDGGIVIGPETQIVVVEGNYVALKDGDWTQLQQYVDETWMCEAPRQVIHRRLVARHLAAGICDTPSEASHRAATVDEPNGEYIATNSHSPQVVIDTTV